MKIVKNVINIGIEKPFTIIHTSDTHITRTDAKDSIIRKKFASERCKTFFQNSEENLEFISNYVNKTGHLLVHTGDLIDFITPENLKAANAFAKETNMLFIAGNHEMATCPNNVFCEKDYAVDLENKESTLDSVQKFFYNDIRFFCKEINGVCLVGINNSNYQISLKDLDKLKQVLALNKPIILFTHIPFYSEELCKKEKRFMLATPEKIVNTLTPWQIFEQKANKETMQAYDYICSQSLIKCFVSGHLHLDFESSSENKINQLVTDINTLREIVIR